MNINFEKIIRKLNAKANTIYFDKGKIRDLLGKARKKAEGNKELMSLWEDLKIALELVKDWIKGEYKDLSKNSVIMIIISLLYLVNPFDIIPDFIIGGFIDDAAVIAYIFKKIASEINLYKEWRNRREDPDYTNEIIDVTNNTSNSSSNIEN